jgi:hypothetical protein
MAFQVSPGVLTREIDLTNVVPAVATSIGGIAGAFEKGPVNEVVTVGSEQELVQVFGKPNASNFETWFTAANFLSYTNQLKVVRAESGIISASANGGASLLSDSGDGSTTDFTMGAAVAAADADLLYVTVDDVVTEAFSVSGTTIAFDNAPANGVDVVVKQGVRITNRDFYESNYADGSGSVGGWASRTPGAWGNAIGVSVCQGAAAYEQISASTVDGAHNAGVTTVTVDDGTAFQVHDIVYFQESDGQQYEVTAISTNDLTIRQLDNPNEGGLKTNVEDATVVRRRWRFYDLFDEAPATSNWAKGKSLPNALDEMHVVVYDTTGAITAYDVDVAGNRTNAVMETYSFLSKHPFAKTAQGGTNYYVDVINQQSLFVWWMDHATVGTDWGSNLTAGGADTAFVASGLPVNDELSGGKDDYDANVGEINSAYQFLGDAETLDVNLIIGGKTPDETVGTPADGKTHVDNLLTLAEQRKDCVAFVSPPRNHVGGVSSSITQTSNIIDFFQDVNSSSYIVFDSGYKYMYDKYNDTYRYVPLNGDIAGLAANTDTVADPWFSPAGYNRGQIRGAVKLAYSPNKTQRDQLYPARINPVVTFPGQGTIMFGDKTALSRPSAFDRINVRRLFIVLEKAIATAAKFQLFEFNDEFTRAQFVNLVEPFLRDVQGRRGITDFSVVCDETNNTGEVIDRNEFVADIYIKPARSINFITLNFIAVRTGVAFSEVGG